MSAHEHDHDRERNQAWRLGVLSGLTVACAGVLLYLAQVATSYRAMYAEFRSYELPLGTVLAINPILSYAVAAAITVAVVLANKLGNRQWLANRVAAGACAVGAIAVAFVYWYSTLPMRQLADGISH